MGVGRERCSNVAAAVLAERTCEVAGEAAQNSCRSMSSILLNWNVESSPPLLWSGPCSAAYYTNGLCLSQRQWCP